MSRRASDLPHLPDDVLLRLARALAEQGLRLGGPMAKSDKRWRARADLMVRCDAVARECEGRAGAGLHLRMGIAGQLVRAAAALAAETDAGRALTWQFVVMGLAFLSRTNGAK